MVQLVLQPGVILKAGEYKIIRTLGQGGFGITYEAEQVNLGRTVAIKEFFMKDCCERDADTSQMTIGTGAQRELVEKFRRKFIREARMLASFNHRHIVRVHDVFEENGTAYYVMENLPGGSLASLIKQNGPLNEAHAEHYIRQIAEALDYVHSRNAVHLDVKPSNILLSDTGEAILIDFGISKHYDSAGEQTSSTPVGISKGFAPLEQGRDGDVSQFKPSTDIYALGATLYFLATGSVPPEATIVAEEGLSRPENVSDRMWSAISVAMKPFRKDRPQSIAAFLHLLDIHPQAEPEEEPTIIKGKPVAAPKPEATPKGTVKKSPPSKAWLWGALSAIVAAAVILAIVLGRGEKTPARTSGNINGHEWVDLGLSVKWATCNVGASSPSDYGGYYAWGETATKSDYSGETYKYRVSGEWWESTATFSKYNTKSETGIVDNKTRLDRTDDAARANWGGTWRMATYAEWTELRTKCEWIWTSQGGHNGYKVTGPNGNSIFLPAAGYRTGTLLGNAGSDAGSDAGSVGNYWSSSLNADYPTLAYCGVGFVSDYVGWDDLNRYHGFSVRPVTE